MNPIEQQFKVILDNQAWENFELWVIKVNGKIVTTSTGRNSWNSERGARQGWAHHISRSIKHQYRYVYNPITQLYDKIILPDLNLPQGIKQTDFTEWCVQNKFLEFVRIA